MAGLFSDVKRKNAETIAYFHDQDRQAVKTRVLAKTDRRRNGPEETLVVLRECQDGGTVKHDYHLSNASP